VFDGKGNLEKSFAGALKRPVSVAVSPEGLIYVLDRMTGEISVFDREGVLRYKLSRKGIREGELAHPSYIFIDRAGVIYVSDGDRVQVFVEE
jgi:DNA-binding beta-propeller fold protein YncE